MARAAAVIVLITLGCHESLRLVRGTSNARPYGQLRRRRSSPVRGDTLQTSFVAPPSSSSIRERERSMAPASSAVKAPWGVTSWVGPQARRRYSERPWQSKPHSKVGSCTAETAEGAEKALSSRTSSVLNASGRSKEASTIGGLALPLGTNTASRITAVKVDNLAMVDSVSIEVRKKQLCSSVVEASVSVTQWCVRVDRRGCVVSVCIIAASFATLSSIRVR